MFFGPILSTAPIIRLGCHRSRKTADRLAVWGRDAEHELAPAAVLALRRFIQGPRRRRGSFRRGFGKEFERPVQDGLGFVQLAIADQRFGLLHDLSHGRGVAPLLLPTADASLHPVPL